MVCNGCTIPGEILGGPKYQKPLLYIKTSVLRYLI